MRIADEKWEMAWDIYTNTSNWKLMSGRDEETGCVYTKQVDHKKVFKLEALIKISLYI